MTSPVLTCHDYDLASTVLGILRDKDLSSAPAIDAHGILRGVVHLIDLERPPKHLFGKEFTVKSIMVPAARCTSVSETMPLAEVEALLLSELVGRLPVLDSDGRVTGILTRKDILRQRNYYPSLHYHNKGFADSIAKRAYWRDLRSYLKRFDPD